MSGRRWRGWSQRSEVERVELYTLQSLRFILWLTVPVVLLTVPLERHPGLAVLVLSAGVVLGLAASRLLTAAVPAYASAAPPPRGPALTLVLLAVATVAVAVPLPTAFGVAAATLVSATLAWGFGGYRGRTVTTALLVAMAAAPFLVEPWWGSVALGLGIGGFLVFTVRSSLWLFGVVTELDRARGAQAALAVAEERLRFSRDVHDVLGRRLSTIAVQAELAATLARRGDDRAADRMADVRATAHDGLREARELARGYRATSLEQELDGAGALLRSAGIACRVDVPDLPGAWHEPGAWVVREAVTNVLRHSAATQVEITYDGHTLAVRNDGVGEDKPSGQGAGLVGLAERLAPLGARVETRRESGHHVLEVVLP